MSTDLAGEVPRYAVCEPQRDGKLQILSEHADARAALDAAQLACWAGRAAVVYSISRVYGRVDE